MPLRQRSFDRFFEKNADSIYRIAKDYLNLDNSPFDFVNIDDSNRKMIFCPILTLAAAKDEMKAIRDCQRRQRDSPCDHTQTVVHCFPKVKSRPRDSLAVSLKRYLFWGKTEDILDPDPSRSQEDIARKDLVRGMRRDAMFQRVHTSFDRPPTNLRKEAGITLFLSSSQPADGKQHIVFARARVGEVLNGTGQRKPLFFQQGKHFLENIRLVTFCLKIFKAGNHPLCPTIGSRYLVLTFHSGQIQPSAETGLPGTEGPGKIRHGSPNAHQVSAFIFLRQIRHFVKMSIGICP